MKPLNSPEDSNQPSLIEDVEPLLESDTDVSNASPTVEMPVVREVDARIQNTTSSFWDRFKKRLSGHRSDPHKRRAMQTPPRIIDRNDPNVCMMQNENSPREQAVHAVFSDKAFLAQLTEEHGNPASARPSA